MNCTNIIIYFIFTECAIKKSQDKFVYVIIYNHKISLNMITYCLV